MTYRKHKGQPLDALKSDVAFTTALQLEECEARLADMDTRRDDITVASIATNSDRVHFAIRRVEHGQITANATGTLRRWQGTSTRVECNGVLRSKSIYAEWALQLAAGLMGAILTWMGFLLLVWSGWFIVHDWLAMLRCWMLPMLIVAFVTFYVSSSLISDYFNKREYQARKNLDALLHRVVETLMVKEDGSSVEDDEIITPKKHSIERH